MADVYSAMRFYDAPDHARPLGNIHATCKTRCCVCSNCNDNNNAVPPLSIQAAHGKQVLSLSLALTTRSAKAVGGITLATLEPPYPLLAWPLRNGPQLLPYPSSSKATNYLGVQTSFHYVTSFTFSDFPGRVLKRNSVHSPKGSLVDTRRK